MRKVLLVEDEAMIRKGLALTFDWTSCDCFVYGEAANGKEALAFIDTHTPDIVITDIRMPVMDGIDLLHACRHRTDIDFIVLSSYDEFSYAKQAMRYGAVDYLLKPLDHEELAGVLKRAVPTETVVPDLLQDEQTEAVSQVIKHVLRYIAEHFNEKLTVQELADYVERSPTFLHQKFKKEMNQTISHYISKYRIQKSIERIQEGKDPIYVIAEEVGFSDYKYFTTVFKKYVGESPSVFMKRV